MRLVGRPEEAQLTATYNDNGLSGIEERAEPWPRADQERRGSFKNLAAAIGSVDSSANLNSDDFDSEDFNSIGETTEKESASVA